MSGKGGGCLGNSKRGMSPYPVSSRQTQPRTDSSKQAGNGAEAEDLLMGPMGDDSVEEAI